MQFFEFSPLSKIYLNGKSTSDNTPEKCIKEAIEFVKEHNIQSLELYYDGFQMLIEPSTDLKELVSEFIRWQNRQTIPK